MATIYNLNAERARRKQEKAFNRKRTREQDDLHIRLVRIRENIERINKLMHQLRSMDKEDSDNDKT